MLHVIRRCRTLALALLLAAPGLGGTWLALAHPCPVDMPWLTGHEHEGHGAQSAHGHGDAHDTSSGSCSCVGACQGGNAALTHSVQPAALRLAVSGWNTAPTAPRTDAPVEHNAHRQPPATAPPLA